MSAGALVAGGVLLGPFVGIVAGGLEAKEQVGGKEMIKKYELPDFGKLMSEHFVERVAKELPGFPQMQLEPQPVKDASQLEAPYLILRVFNLRVDDSGFTAWVTARMVDGDKAEVWLKGYLYQSKDHNRAHSLTEYEAEGGRLLKEEYQYALDDVVLGLIRSLKGS